MVGSSRVPAPLKKRQPQLLELRPAQTQTRGLRPSHAPTDQQPNAAKQGQRQGRRFGNGHHVNPDSGFVGAAIKERVEIGSGSVVKGLITRAIKAAQWA